MCRPTSTNLPFMGLRARGLLYNGIRVVFAGAVTRFIKRKIK